MPEHDQLRRLIERVRGLNSQREAQDQALMKAVTHHIADEETLLLPGAERMLGASRLADLGTCTIARRLALTGQRADQLAEDGVSAVPARTAWMTLGALVAGTLLVRSMQ